MEYERMVFEINSLTKFLCTKKWDFGGCIGVERRRRAAASFWAIFA